MFELLVSVAILTLISTATVMTLNAARPGEELRAASRALTSDIENLSSRALAGANISTCTTLSGSKVCSATNPSLEACTGACINAPPARVGLSIGDVPTASVILFADLDGNGRLSSGNEILSFSQLNPLGGTRVTVNAIASEGSALSGLTLTMDRQNGRMRINACGDAGFPPCGGPEPESATITLTQSQNADLVSTISIDAKTGRASFTL